MKRLNAFKKIWIKSIMKNLIVRFNKYIFHLGSIMMDPEHTKVRNEALRRIKMYKMKEGHLPNFMRKKREEMLA